jgi:hypothetical protein
MKDFTNYHDILIVLVKWIYIENTHFNKRMFMFHSTLHLQGDATVTRAGQDKEWLGKIPLL